MINCGKYLLLEKIGQGKFGKIFKAKIIKNNVLIAIKIENNHYSLLKHETTILNYLNNNKCKNIPLVYWFGIHETYPCLVIPYYSITLVQILKDKSIDFNMDKLMHSMLSIIESIHKSSVIHRDIKPENFMINNCREIILIDFGLATFSIEEDCIKKQNNMIGNVLFASPNVQEMNTPRRIDDLISISYIGLLFHLGYLPWNFNTDIIFMKKIENINKYRDNCNIFDYIQNLYNNRLCYKF
jgi:serine/threonine protein kinase